MKGFVVLNHFFAVTTTSLYEILAKGKESNGWPVVQKIDLDKPSAIALGQELNRGPMVAIGKIIVTYINEGGGITSFERRIEYVNTRYWCGYTSQVVALFKNLKVAKACFKHKDRVPEDPRWKKQTEAVLKEIGTDHPVFYICEDSRMKLFSE